MNEGINKKFQKAREAFPHTDNIVYFNAAANGPFSVDVKQEIDRFVEGCTSGDVSFDVDSNDLRDGYGRLIGASTNQIGLGHNTSVGLNIAAFGLPLERGDEVLVSDVEFPALIYIWKAAAEARGLKIKYVKSREGCFDLDEFRQSITNKSKVFSVSWVQFFNGYKSDLKDLMDICREHGLYSVIDGIQGAGVEPIDVRNLGVDIFSSGCHKWLLAPIGCGFFYLADHIRDRITRPFASWLGVDWKENYTDLRHYDRQPWDSARRFEMGYYASVNLIGMQQSLKLFEDLGPVNIQRHNYALIDQLAEYVRGSEFYRITSCMEPKHRSSIFTFTCNKVAELHARLLKEKIFLAHREGSIRVAVHLYNNKQDIERLIGVLEKFSR